MALQPFIWSGNQAITTPEAAERRRRVAEAMIGQASTPASNWAEGLADVAAAFTGTQLQNQAAAAEEAGRLSAAQALAAIGPSASFEDIAGALSNPWLSGPQSTVAAALLQQNMQRSDPAYQLELEMKRAQLAALQAPQPVDPWANYKIVNDQVVTIGPDGPQAIGDFRSPDSPLVTVSNMGNIPAGYQVVQDPITNTTRMEPIEGSPAWLEQQAALERQNAVAGSQDTSTSIITSAAQKARDAYNSGAITTGVVGNTLALDPGSQAAEMRRHVETLKANASIENLNAMRQASPTGGALGSVTEKENAMLANKLGALDPASPNFLQQLEDYERTLLEIVHGPQAGREIYESSRPPPNPGETVVMDGVKWRFRGGDPGDQNNWERL